MNEDFEKTILDRAKVDDSIFDMKNVQSFYPGTKVSKGKDTGTPCIVIGVKRKEPGESLSEKDIIPKFLSGGIETDVIEEGNIDRYGLCGSMGHLSGLAPSGVCDGHDYFEGNPYSNIQGGISIGPSGDSRTWSGTLGLIVRDKISGKLVGISNNHVLGDYIDERFEIIDCFKRNGELMDIFKLNSSSLPVVENSIQTPSQSDASSGEMIVGRVGRCVPTKWGNLPSLPVNTVDAGIIELSENVSPMVDVAHLNFKPVKVGAAESGKNVKKSGRTTGVTGVSDLSSKAVIVSTNYTVSVGSGCGGGLRAKFADCIKIDWNNSRNNKWEWFSCAGDSGSSIFMERDGLDDVLVGTLFAGTSFQNSQNIPNPPYGSSIACKIQNVFNELSLEPWEGEVICSSENQIIKVNGQCYSNTRSIKPPELVSHNNFSEVASLDECK